MIVSNGKMTRSLAKTILGENYDSLFRLAVDESGGVITSEDEHGWETSLEIAIGDGYPRESVLKKMIEIRNRFNPHDPWELWESRRIDPGQIGNGRYAYHQNLFDKK